jgi:hypothetical protein
MESICANLVVNGEWSMVNYISQMTRICTDKFSVAFCEICETIKLTRISNVREPIAIGCK